jgi:hypothetical protein
MSGATRHRLSRRRRLIFTMVAVALAIGVPSAALLAVDIYLHGRYQTSAGYNVWGYRGAVVGRKQPGETRIVVVGGSAAYGYGVNWDQAMPVLLQRALAARSQRKFTVVNLGYNNEGAYSLNFTLRDYAYLHYDVAVLYESYNDLMTPPHLPNLSVYRRDSPVFRLTGYLPIFPLIFKEKAAILLHGGALYREPGKTVFRPSVSQRAAAGMLNTAAEIGQSLERQLDRMTAEPQRRVVDGGSSGCQFPWGDYCRSMLDAVDYAVGAGKLVLVVGQPYEPGPNRRPRHMDQQRELQDAVSRRFGGNTRVRYLNLGTAVELADPRLSFDQMHLTPEGNAQIADALVAPVLDITSGQQVPIQSFHVIDEPIDAVPVHHGLASADAHRAPPLGIVEQRPDRIRERLRVAERGEQADVRSGQHVADAADVRADAGHRRREAFDQRHGRALVARGQEKHVRRAIDDREIAAPAEEPRSVVNAEIARGLFELVAQLAVAGDEEQRARMSSGDSSCGHEKQPVLLDGREAADRGHDLPLVWNAQRLPAVATIAIGEGGERAELESQRNDMVLIGPADAMVCQQLALNPWRDCDDRVGRLRELTLGRGEQPGRPGSEVPLEDVAVIGVHDARACAPSLRAVVRERRDTSDRAGLCHVCVHDVRPEAAERAEHLRQRGGVLERSDPTLQGRDVGRSDAAVRQQITHVAFAGAQASVDQKRLDAALRQTLGERHGLNGRPADIQARDDSRDAHRGDNITRLFQKRFA